MGHSVSHCNACLYHVAGDIDFHCLHIPPSSLAHVRHLKHLANLMLDTSNCHFIATLQEAHVHISPSLNYGTVGKQFLGKAGKQFLGKAGNWELWETAPKLGVKHWGIMGNSFLGKWGIVGNSFLGKWGIAGNSFLGKWGICFRESWEMEYWEVWEL